MKFKARKGALLKVLSIAGRTAESKASVKSLDRIRLKVDDGIEILSTDGTVFTRCTISAEEIERPGDLLVYSKLFISIVSSLPVKDDQEISFEHQDGGKLHISAGKTSHELNTFSSDAFLPFVEVDTGRDFIVLNGSDFADAIAQVAPCVSRNNTKPQYTGVYMSVEDDGITFAATDSSRFAYRFLKSSTDGLEKGVSIIAPLKAVEDIRKLADGKPECKIILSDRVIGYEDESTLLVSKLLNVEFPYFREILPRDPSQGFSSINTESFKGAVKSLMPLAHESNMVTAMMLRGGQLTLTAISEQSGRSVAEMVMEQKCADMDMMFNLSYIIDVLNCLETENFELKLTSQVEPAIFKMEERDDFYYILMPMRL
ncbi:MAG: DNA polymerase III subunit beta [Candidatus Wallbacteria bacterium HGW-Wallbacteria-1]|jgi:DNA polymerase-3 subunit beta|uniref:Beta sliding clamp n=1 Tax=Candidatus Wallbacteria bacterium HGW-Wallbacteria-1 TaxID=2013854 RepID=A0A2N1PUQ2_9BACT|nr:MAG: DNA polymerase III subunit beta [Candidatus Wallbacteria bacterium HGW-Wallbacteria-1]